jgi:hypothetical protein
VNVTNVRNFTNVNITNVQDIHYAYRTTAVTAVNADTFRSGQPVQRGIVKVTPEQMARAQVIAHPSVIPARTAILSHPVAAPKGVRPSSFAGATRPGQPGATSRTGAPPVSRTQPANSSGAHAGPSANTSRPAFVTKNPPPAPKPSFSTRQPAMSYHPGRPLEPQQLNNLSNGRPAGPQYDREFAPHSPLMHSAPPPQHSAPPRGGKSH